MADRVIPDTIEIGTKLRAARLEKDLSLRQLALMADVSASLLSQIENGKANPSVRSLYSIADALALPVDYFFPTTKPDHEVESADETETDLTASEMRLLQVESQGTFPDTTVIEEQSRTTGPVVRAQDRPLIELQGNVTWERLTAEAEDNIEFLEINYRVGASSGKKMSRHTGREFGLILEGELLLELGFDSYHLQQGDSIIFDSMTPHRLVNRGQVPVKAIWVVMDSE